MLEAAFGVADSLAEFVVGAVPLRAALAFFFKRRLRLDDG